MKDFFLVSSVGDLAIESSVRLLTTKSRTDDVPVVLLPPFQMHSQEIWLW